MFRLLLLFLRAIAIVSKRVDVIGSVGYLLPLRGEIFYSVSNDAGRILLLLLNRHFPVQRKKILFLSIHKKKFSEECLSF